MTKNRKINTHRILSLLLSLVFMLSLLPTAAFATEGTQDSGGYTLTLRYATTGGTAKVTSGSSSLESDGGTIQVAAGETVHLSGTVGGGASCINWTCTKTADMTTFKPTFVSETNASFTMPESAVNVSAAFGDHTTNGTAYDNDGHWTGCQSCGFGSSSKISHSYDGDQDEICNGCEYRRALPTATYTVTFNANGGSGSMDQQTFTAGVEQSLTPNTYTREGYFFLRWNTAENGGGQGYTDGQSITLTDNLTLYALWHQHTYGGYIYTDGTGHYQECTDSNCPDANKGRTATEPHTGDFNYPAGCTDCHYSTIPLTVSISPTYLINGGTVTITTSKYADQVTTYRDYTITTSDHINWTTTIPGDASARSHFTATAGKETVESESFYLSPTFWINPTSETLTGGGTVTLVTAVPVSSVTCDASGISVQGSGDEWTATLPNSTATYTFTATLDNHTDTCTVSVVKGNTITFHGNNGGGSMNPIAVKEGEQVALPACSFTAPDGFTFAYWSTKANGAGTQYESGKILKPSADMTLYAIWKAAYVTDNSSDDDVVYTPPIPTDTEQNENGDTVTTAEPSTVVKKDTATSTITVTDGNRLVNEVVRNGSDQLVIAPKIGQDVSGVEVSIPATVVKQLAERTDADLQIATGVAEVNIGSAELDGHSGSLVMEAQRTEDGISTKVSIGGVTVLDTSVMLFVSLNNLPDDGKLVVGTLQPSADNLDFVLGLDVNTEYVSVASDDIALVTPFMLNGVTFYQYDVVVFGGEEFVVVGNTDDGLHLVSFSDGNAYFFDGEYLRLAGAAPHSDIEERDNQKLNINGVTYDVIAALDGQASLDRLILYHNGKPAGQYHLTTGKATFNEGFDPETLKAQQDENYLGAVTPGENPIDGLVSGKTYNVSVIGAQDISVPGYDEAVFNQSRN